MAVNFCAFNLILIVFLSPVRNLIFPARFDAYIPVFYNHMIHTLVIPLQLLELCLQYHVYPTKKTGMAVTGKQRRGF